MLTLVKWFLSCVICRGVCVSSLVQQRHLCCPSLCHGPTGNTGCWQSQRVAADGCNRLWQQLHEQLLPPPLAPQPQLHQLPTPLQPPLSPSWGSAAGATAWRVTAHQTHPPYPHLPLLHQQCSCHCQQPCEGAWGLLNWSPPAHCLPTDSHPLLVSSTWGCSACFRGPWLLCCSGCCSCCVVDSRLALPPLMWDHNCWCNNRHAPQRLQCAAPGLLLLLLLLQGAPGGGINWHAGCCLKLAAPRSIQHASGCRARCNCCVSELLSLLLHHHPAC
jgi:hypothetical protein